MACTPRINVSVVVLGDLGRSPRMQYHARALAAELADVDLIGYAGTPLHPSVRSDPHIRVHELPPPRFTGQHRLPRPLFVVYSLLKVLRQVTQLIRSLWAGQKPDFVLVQSPPAIPTLLIGWLVARSRSSKLVIDWHNFGYTMLALTLGENHVGVRLARWHERVVARRADAHLCVSRAMQTRLADDFGVSAVVLHDRPAEIFAPTPLHLRHDLFMRLAGAIGDLESREPQTAVAGAEEERGHGEDTLVTTLRVPRQHLVGEVALYCASRRTPEDRGSVARTPPESLLPFVRLRSGRPAIVVSATSWTADEDFTMLLDAVSQCDRMIRARDPELGRPFPHVVVLITGRGPLREPCEKRMRQLALQKIHLRTLWLSPQDYPLLLGAADLGICMHRSSSGVDLPMKIADMFGAGLPVCALDYGPCLAEMVRHGENGLAFASAEQLAEQLFELFQDFPHDTPWLDRLRCNVTAASSIRWTDGWKADAQGVFRRQ